MKKSYSILSIVLASSICATAQNLNQQKSNPQESATTLIAYGKENILKLNSKWKSEVDEFLKNHPEMKRVTYQNGEMIYLERIDRYGAPVFIGSETNREGALTINANRLYTGGDLNYNINGEGMETVTWDSGYPRTSHDEIVGRSFIGENGAAISRHSTHVAGTIMAAGLNPDLKGIAPKAKLTSFDFGDDTTEMFAQAEDGLLVSNHSYGRISDNTTDVAYFGKYDELANGYDLIAFLYPKYLTVVSAGNDRNDGLNPNDQGYDLLTDRSVAKNSITVGAVNSVLNYTDAFSVVMSSFSSYGPTDDGRIKPDLVAMGVGVNSLGSESNSATVVLNGTSMATPMVTGGILLLQQFYNQKESSYMNAATVKAIALMTAKEAGDHPGPDYKYGWGLFDVAAAAQLIESRNTSSVISELSLADGDSYTETFTAMNSEKLTIALSWTDLPGELPSDVEDDSTPVLVSDLDIQVIAEDGTIHYPWRLDVDNPASAADKGINSVDVIEIVEINNPIGNYTVNVTHKDNLRITQPFSLVINGGIPVTASLSNNIGNKNFQIFPNPANDHLDLTFNLDFFQDNVNIEIITLQGQTIDSSTLQLLDGNRARIDVSNLSSGVYFLKINDSTSSYIEQFIKF